MKFITQVRGSARLWWWCEWWLLFPHLLNTVMNILDFCFSVWRIHARLECNKMFRPSAWPRPLVVVMRVMVVISVQCVAPPTCVGDASDVCYFRTYWIQSSLECNKIYRTSAWLRPVLVVVRAMVAISALIEYSAWPRPLVLVMRVMVALPNPRACVRTAKRRRLAAETTIFACCRIRFSLGRGENSNNIINRARIFRRRALGRGTVCRKKKC